MHPHAQQTQGDVLSKAGERRESVLCSHVGAGAKHRQRDQLDDPDQQRLPNVPQHRDQGLALVHQRQGIGVPRQSHAAPGKAKRDCHHHQRHDAVVHERLNNAPGQLAGEQVAKIDRLQGGRRGTHQRPQVLARLQRIGQRDADGDCQTGVDQRDRQQLQEIRTGHAKAQNRLQHGKKHQWRGGCLDQLQHPLRDRRQRRCGGRIGQSECRPGQQGNDDEAYVAEQLFHEVAGSGSS